MKGKGFIYRFLVRWFVCSLGIWIAAQVLGSYVSFDTVDAVVTPVIVSGLILAVINTLLKPILVVLSLPVVLLSLGLFMVIINGFTVFLVTKVYGVLHVSSFWGAVLAGVIIGLVNYLVTTILESKES